MPADPKDTVKEADVAGEEAPAAPAKPKRYRVVRAFTGYMHSQLLHFEKGAELDTHVGEYFHPRAGGDVEAVED